MANFGVSFMPGAQEPNGNGGVPSRQPGGDRIQEAIRLLNLRLPKRYGTGAIAPPELLNAPGGMGMPGAQGNTTAQALAILAGLFAPGFHGAQDNQGTGGMPYRPGQTGPVSYAPGPSPSPSYPTPVIRPGQSDKPPEYMPLPPAAPPPALSSPEPSYDDTSYESPTPYEDWLREDRRYIP